MKRSLVGLFTLALAAGCTASTTGNTTATNLGNPAVPAALRLVSYNSCDELLKSVRDAAKQSVGPWGFRNGGVELYGERAMAREAPQSQDSAKSGTPDYSKTNTHEAGVDEPDMVKTDGKRIIIANGNIITVIDAATRSTIDTLRLSDSNGVQGLLLHGDRLLVLARSSGQYGNAKGTDSRIAPWGYSQQTSVRMIDLSGGRLREGGEFVIDASLTDARQVGSVARVVVRSTPVIQFPMKPDQNDKQRLADNRKLIEKSPLSAWLPAYQSNGVKGQVDCGAVSRPQAFSGASLVTVLSFDLATGALSSGNPVSVLADAETIYGSGPNLYVAHDERWRSWVSFRGDVPWRPETPAKTDIFQFDITGPRPVFVAAGSVQGYLLNQYSMSEHNDILRVATTTGEAMWGQTAKSESTVYTLGRSGGTLRELGHVGGLGKGERIYAVRFIGTTGYVVTFRQTDPLYAIDLKDPQRPRVTGELKITGYSAYLHPISDNRLLGVGQEASEQGRREGTQVSLFDVGGADPKRLDQFHVPFGHSNAEYDAHAFLYWPATRLLVLPIATYEPQSSRDSGAVLLRIDDMKITEVGHISQQGMMRSLIIGEVLWTISHERAQASTLDGNPISSVKLD